MPTPEFRQHLAKSAEAIGAGDFELARFEAAAAIRIEATADGFTLLGIALARQKKADLAVEAFRQAFKLGPTEPRHGYNLAAHLFAIGEDWPANTAITEALKDDPNFEPAKKLRDRIDHRDRDGEIEFLIPEIDGHIAEEVLPSSEEHLILPMRGMEAPWTSFGWFLIGIGVLAAVLMFIFQPIPNPLNAAVGQKLPAVRPGVGPMTAVFFMALSGISSFMWVLIDLVDKKLRLVWIVPMVACCACGLQAIPHAFYMFMRKN